MDTAAGGGSGGVFGAPGARTYATGALHHALFFSFGQNAPVHLVSDAPELAIEPDTLGLYVVENVVDLEITHLTNTWCDVSRIYEVYDKCRQCRAVHCHVHTSAKHLGFSDTRFTSLREDTTYRYVEITVHGDAINEYVRRMHLNLFNNFRSPPRRCRCTPRRSDLDK